MEATTTAAPPAGQLAPEAFAERAKAIEREVGRVIVGQADLVRHTLTCLLANGHAYVAAARNVPGLENLTNLDQLPARGAIVIALPMKIEGGSGGPLRAVALVGSSRR